VNNRGTIAVLSAVLAVPIVLSAGLALDVSRLWLLRQRMQWAVDTAALLGASQSNGETADLVTKDAKELFWASYGAPLTSSNTSGSQVGYLGSSSTGATVTTATAAVPANNQNNQNNQNDGENPGTPSNPYVTVTASATLPTTLMQLAGRRFSTVTTTSVAAVPHRVEMTLVLDNSLSMGLAINGANSKLAALQTAANNLLTTIMGSGSASSPNVSIGIVPFAGAVNVGNDSIGQSFIRGGVLATKFPSGSASSLGWRGCVQARAYAGSATSYDSTEDSTTSSNAQMFDPYYYPSTSAQASALNTTGDNDWTSSKINDTSTASQSANTNYLPPYNQLYYGPNLYCPYSSLVKLTNNKVTLTNSINNMTIVNGGGTIINQGLQWGWFTLSPLWTAWGLPPTPTGAARPTAYTDTGTTKIIVLMTDGVSEIDGIDTFYGAAANQYWDKHSNCEHNPNIYPECKDKGQADHPDSWYSSYGRISSGTLVPASTSAKDLNDTLRKQAKDVLKLRLRTLCSNIKAKNVVLYTIFFHGSLDDYLLDATANGAGPELQSCATDANHYFDSQSAAAINTAFQKIALDINDLRIAK